MKEGDARACRVDGAGVVVGSADRDRLCVTLPQAG